MVNDWGSYKEWVASSVKGGAQYYFRGQRKIDWKLQTSFHRYSEKTGITILDYLDRIMPEVHYHVSSMQNENIDISNEVEFGAMLAKLQHHGFPTPLLDWTLSPYIAAYFAYKDIDPHNLDTEYVTIYMFDIKLWLTSFQQPLDLRNPVDFVSNLRPYAKNNNRMIRQMAITTATNVTDMGAYLMRRGAETGKVFLYQAMLPVSERQLVMNELNLMGINSMTMFPEFDGLCSSMKELFFNNIAVQSLVPAPPTQTK